MLEELIAAVLDCEVSELVEVITGRVIILDGLSSHPHPCSSPALYSGARHRSGAAVQFRPTPTANCATSVNQSPDPSTMRGPFRETGLAAILI